MKIGTQITQKTQIAQILSVFFSGHFQVRACVRYTASEGATMTANMTQADLMGRIAAGEGPQQEFKRLIDNG
jgi:hypothetical protein